MAQVKTVRFQRSGSVLQSLVLFSNATRTIYHPRAVNEWGREKKGYSHFNAAAQMRRRHISRRGAVKQGYYAKWGFEERILTFSPTVPHARFTSLFANHFSTWDSVKFPHFRCWPAERGGAPLSIVLHVYILLPEELRQLWMTFRQVF